MIAKLKLLFIERVDENICTRWWMKHAYWDYMNRERVMVAFPLNYIVTLAWRLNLLWNKFRHKPTWIDNFCSKHNQKKNMKDDYFMETVPCVHVGDGEWIATDKVEFVDISEDLQGYDLMTFIYEGKEMQSRITSRPAY